MVGEARRRPKDRRDSIIAAAGSHFHRRGYAGTSLDDIASDLGITAPAIYRHFRGKDDLYTVTLEVNLSQLEACVAAASSSEVVARDLARLGVSHPTLGLLWRPDRRRRLVDADGALERRLTAVVETLAGTLEDTSSPELARVLARAVLATVSSTGFYASPLSPDDHADQLDRALTAVIGFRPEHALTVLDAAEDRPLSRPWTTRRSAVLDACATLVIGRGGYQGVTVEEIAATAEVTTATVYQLFETKADLFAAVLRRAVTWAGAALQQAAAHAESADEALELAVASALEFSARHPSWTGSLADELSSLPARQQQEVAEIVEEYLADWLAVCAAVGRPRPPEVVQVRMRAALAVIDDRAVDVPGHRVLSVEDTTQLVRDILT